jgi:hypothetical protein
MLKPTRTSNELTSNLIQRGITISKIETKNVKEKGQVFLSCNEDINPFVFNWSNNLSR